MFIGDVSSHDNSETRGLSKNAGLPLAGDMTYHGELPLALLRLVLEQSVLIQELRVLLAQSRELLLGALQTVESLEDVFCHAQTQTGHMRNSGKHDLSKAQGQ